MAIPSLYVLAAAISVTSTAVGFMYGAAAHRKRESHRDSQPDSPPRRVNKKKTMTQRRRRPRCRWRSIRHNRRVHAALQTRACCTD
ncbi:hypothetical protein BJV78DRAFT_324302 [Lactifluus subvellereus]|nr:hypothetical protein BJV78DRAFT_324302 [Lactifluus subvellereus]